MTTFYCLNRACRKPIEVQRVIPDRCPHCQEEFSGSTTPPIIAAPVPLPPFETTLTDKGREILKVQKIVV